MIVLGGTIGAVMIQFPLPTVLAAFGSLVRVILERKRDGQAVIRELVGFAQKARKEGIVSLDKDLERIDDPFLD
jgi:chemotaxis protein MotA